MVHRMQEVRAGYEGYQQLAVLKQPIKAALVMMLSVVTLLIIFAAMWFGFYLSKGLTGPIQALAEATDRVAHGEYDFSLEHGAKDELGQLVESFNQMTGDLKGSQERLAEAMAELERRNAETSERRRYTEAVLARVAAGVVSVDRQGRVSTLNGSAESLLGLKAEECLGRPASEVLPPELASLLNETREVSGRQVRFESAGRPVSLLIHVSPLPEGEGESGVTGEGQGAVMVFEDMTQLEKAQRMAAWREVARRIAHEIKNPLTPIQLSAQRLRRRYLDKFGQEGAVFDECTRLIVDQVEQLKGLVNEFSAFARLPQANPVPTDVLELVTDIVVLYEQAHRDVSFGVRHDGRLPKLNVDREQMKRVLINLMDNAVDSLGSTGDGPREVTVELIYDPIIKLARIEVQDTGSGISAEDKLRLFEPYFSTKSTGTGLGLAIVSAIVADHNGYIRVRDNEPRGSRFIIELPAG